MSEIDDALKRCNDSIENAINLADPALAQADAELNFKRVTVAALNAIQSAVTALEESIAKSNIQNADDRLLTELHQHEKDDVAEHQALLNEIHAAEVNIASAAIAATAAKAQ